MANRTLRVARSIHLYFGLFISPALLFFAFTGALQTFSLHEQVAGSSYKPARWEIVLATLHKKATTEVRQRPRPAAQSTPATTSPVPDANGDHHAYRSAPTADANYAAQPAMQPRADPSPSGGKTERQKHLPMKIFFLLVAIGLFTSTLTGVYMAYKYGRNAWVVTAWWIAGVVVPLILLKL